LAAGHDFLPHAVTELYDAYGSGKHAQQIQLRHHPVVTLTSVKYWSNQQWNDTYQGQYDDPLNVNYLPAFYFYQPEDTIEFYTLAIERRQGYQVNYTYGYTSVPDDVVDLCARMAALDVMLNQAGGTISQFSVATLRITYAGGWELGKQEELLMSGINRDLRNLRRMMVSSG
jgi:hypothetical protein